MICEGHKFEGILNHKINKTFGPHEFKYFHRISTGSHYITNVFVFVGMESSEESLSSSPADRYVNLSTNVYSKSAFKILSL